MNPLFQDASSPVAPQKGFAFFPPRPVDAAGEGREPHASLKWDPLERQFPTERQIGWFLFVFSLALYVASLSWAPFPGLPVKSLLAHLGLDMVPATLDPLWGGLVRVFDRLPGLSVAGWAGLFSAACGAACVALVGRLMMRTGYLIRNEPGPETLVREGQARRLSGLVAGLYLACGIPFWVVSTRSLPGSFHLLMLLAAAWFFSQYQHWGKLRHLFLVGLLCGAGTTEFATFIVFLPLTVLLVAHEMFRWRALLSWKPQLVVWCGLLLGLALYPLHAEMLFGRGAAVGLFTSPWQAWGAILREQVLLITQVRFSPGFPVIMFFSLVPWLVIFAFSRRSPWFYESGQIAVRLIFVGGLLGVLYNASFAPWRLLGMSYLMVTPYLLLAACMGFMAGEFWILGERQHLVDFTFAKRMVWRARRLSSVFALTLPIAILAGGACNWRQVNGRHGDVVEIAAKELLGRLDGRDLVFSTGLLDDSLRLAIAQQKAPVLLISASQTFSPLYLRRLAASFAEDSLRLPLSQSDFGLFLDNLLMSASGPARTSIIDMPEVFREYGYLVPDGFAYRLEPSADRVDLAALIELQRPFWARMEQVAAHPAPAANMIRPYQDMLRLLASKVANNLGVMQAERGDAAGAVETFRTARRIYADNLSVLMNLLELGRSHPLPDQEALDSEWNDQMEQLRGERWALAIRFGYVWHARQWVRRGWVWALSGEPLSDEAARRNLSRSDEGNGETAQLLDQAYLQLGTQSRDEFSCRSLLLQDDRNTEALMAMGRLALRRNDPESAEAYIKESMSLGLPEEQVLFDRAMVAYVKGEKEQALAALRNLVRLAPGDARAWMALALLTDKADPENAQAMKALKDHRAVEIGLPLALAVLQRSRQEWAEAQTELEKALQIDSNNVQAWEMMAAVAQEQGNPQLMKSSLRALLVRNPEHFLRYQQEGFEYYQKGQLAEAEKAFRDGIQRGRDATLLNNLASVIVERGGDLQEALELIDEAVRRQPGNAVILSTRGEILLKLERYEEARQVLQEALKKRGRNNDLLLQLAQSYEGLGDRPQALTVAKALAKQPDKLDAEQQRKLRELLLRLR
jgi:tetratricopeptide (TPR) repeat protein